METKSLKIDLQRFAEGDPIPPPHYLITKPRRFSYIVDHAGGVLTANCKNIEAELLPVGVDVVN